MWVDQRKYALAGGVLQAARERAKMTQADLAKRLGKPQSFVSAYEGGQRRVDVLELLRIADTLGTDARVLLSQIQRIVHPVKK